MSAKTRWSLVNLGFVNWYLINARDIEVTEDGIILLTGPNGAGKSSILDGISTVLQGAPRDIALNAIVQKSRAQSKRTLRDYALGTIDDIHLRDSALTALLLGWRHNKTGQELTACIFIEADEQSSDPVIRRLIVGKRILKAEEIILRSEADSDIITPMTWESILSKLREEKLDYQTYDGATAFSQELCSMLSPKGGTIRHKKFLKNLKHMMAYKDVANPTTFVREYVLDKPDVDFTSLRRSIQTYQEIQRKVEEAVNNLARIKSMDSELSAVVTRRRRLARLRTEEVHYKLHFAHLDHLRARAEHEQAGQALTQAEQQEVAARLVLTEAQARYHDALAAIQSSDGAVRRQAADLRYAEASRAFNQADNPLVDLDAAARQLHPMKVFAEGLELPLAMPQPPAWEGHGRLAAQMRGIQKAQMQALEAEVRERLGLASTAAQRAKDELTLATENVARVQSGKLPLSEPTEQLMKLLEANGIEAEPLCETVNWVDEDWRDAVEVVLGPEREALLVPPSRAREAMELVRVREMPGRVIDTTRTADAPEPTRGSLATKVRSADPRATGYLNYRLGHTHCASSVDEAMRKPTAVTKDLFYYSAWSGRSRRNERRGHLLGQAGLLDPTPLEEALAKASRAYKLAKGQQDEAQSALVAICNGLRALETLQKADLPSMLAERGAKRAELEEARRLKADAEAGKNIEEAQLAAEKRALASLDAHHRQAVSVHGGCLVAVKNAQKAIQDTLEKAAQHRRALATALETDGPWLSEDQMALQQSFVAGADVPAPETGQIEVLLEDNAEGYRAVIQAEANRLISNEVNRVVSDFGTVDTKLRNYSQECGIAIPPADDPDSRIRDDQVRDARMRTLQEWLAAQRDWLESHELVKRKAEAEGAYRQAIKHLGEDYIGRMATAVEEQQRQLRELNRNLRERQFHGMKYRFISQALPDFAGLLELLDNPPEPGSDLPLFATGAETPAGPQSRVLAKLQRDIFDPTAELSELSDPRQWYTYDIEMTHPDGVKTTLSKRQGTGSGGQVQVPFYVAMCSALAATSFVTPGGHDGGLALAILDEAFQRMDSEAIGETVRLFHESGLQLIVAVPDNQQTIFMQFSGTMLNFFRSGTALELTQTRLDEEGRAIFHRENPAFLGFDGFKAKHAGTAALPEAAD
ncbi:MAG TPA: SbcC/MukB-like Walker B domain-containing protein [Geminicoccus sp.]|uniref:SbcC/MukB-like Walker B domain-containing protein n=1 Tax=Geminicoccus sp. TaxID=2024832 RepID=UPI002CC39FA9|nr:SbcC/MukB-like Walker B domain-containing protein [Geminicoccus sp.]HWL69438.1 SbcC/MukB-like Walker B domain-containing protein [Geminicoccus sp.]